MRRLNKSRPQISGVYAGQLTPLQQAGHHRRKVYNMSKVTKATSATAEVAPVPQAVENTTTPEANAKPRQVRERVEYRFDSKLFPVPEGVKPEEFKGGPKLTEAKLPANYSTGRHKPLRKGDFEAETLYYEFMAIQSEEDAKRYRQMAEDSKNVGDTAQRGKVKKLRGLTDRLAQLAQELAADGQDVVALLGEEKARALGLIPSA